MVLDVKMMGRNDINLTKSQQSARECRYRKKLRFQYLEELMKSCENAVLVLRGELEQLKQLCVDIDKEGLTTEHNITMHAMLSKVESSS